VTRPLIEQPVVADGDLVALYAGRPSERCRWCGADAAVGTTCPRSLACPTCGARPGRRCKRPSEHQAATMHAARWQAAERMDRAALGVGPVRQPGAPGAARVAGLEPVRQRAAGIVIEAMALFEWMA
jgi:hypothetical protein